MMNSPAFNREVADRSGTVRALALLETKPICIDSERGIPICIVLQAPCLKKDDEASEAGHPKGSGWASGKACRYGQAI
jgi:hypothetical protein